MGVPRTRQPLQLAPVNSFRGIFPLLLVLLIVVCSNSPEVIEFDFGSRIDELVEVAAREGTAVEADELVV